MKKIVLFVLMLVSVAAISQPANYLNIRSRYNLIAVKTDSGFHVPGYSTIPNYRGGVWTGSGNVGVDTVNNKFYFYSGGEWREAGSTNFADSLRRVGLNVQMRKNGNWTSQFDLPDSIPPTPSLKQVLTAGNDLDYKSGNWGINITDSTTGFRIVNNSKLNTSSVFTHNTSGINMSYGSGTIPLGTYNFSLIGVANGGLNMYSNGISGAQSYGISIKKDSIRMGNLSTLNVPALTFDGTGLKFSKLTTAKKRRQFYIDDNGYLFVDDTLRGGTTPAGNYGNVQINRNGALSTPASDSLSFSDKLNVKGNIVGTSKLILGATAAPAQSQVYVTGGVSGGNIDARGDSSSAQKDEANIEVQHADYDGGSFTGYGVALQANGNVSSGTLLGYSNRNSAQLRFTGNTNVIRTLTNASLRFATNNIERVVLDSNGRLGVGVKLPDTTLHVVGSVKIVDGYQGAGKILTDIAGDGVGRWVTPASVADTSYTTIATFTAGGGFASDTTMCTDSTLFGSFFTGQFDYTIAYIHAVIKGNAGDSIVLKLVYNDTFNVDGTKVNGAGLSINNRYTGNVFTISTNRTIAANTWVWLKPEAIITGKKPKYISVTLVGHKTYVAP